LNHEETKDTKKIATDEQSCANPHCSCHHPSDQAAGFEVNEDFQRFRQKNDMFNRSVWDDTVHSEKVIEFFQSYHTEQAKFRNLPGFKHRDYALRNASWYIADFTADLLESQDRNEGFLDHYTLFREGASAPYVEGSPEENSIDIKKVGHYLGADLVGICDYDERWIYAQKYSRQNQQEKPMDLPDDLTSVVVIANEMDYATTQASPSVLASAATGQGYSKDIIAVLSLTAYIRNLGYRAYASLNDTGLSVPLAVKAGLGEYGRLGLLITKEYGPRVRLAKIFTDMLLTPDQPVQFGVQEFCQICKRCARYCPMRAIPKGDPVDEPRSISNHSGVRKWTFDAESCFKMWVNQGTDCSICIRVCPYNKDFSKWHHRLGRWVAGTRLRRVMFWLEGKLGYGKRESPDAWWDEEQ
jgi:epoxyqueuosine reductase